MACVLMDESTRHDVMWNAAVGMWSQAPGSKGAGGTAGWVPVGAGHGGEEERRRAAGKPWGSSGFWWDICDQEDRAVNTRVHSVRWCVVGWGRDVACRNKSSGQGLNLSGSHGKHAPLLTIPCPIFKSSARDLSLPIF